MDNHQALRLRTFLDDVGKCVSETRGLHKLSLRKLSELTGLSHRAIWKVEHGKTDPRLSTLFILSEALGCTVSDFMVAQLAADADPEDPAAERLMGLRLSEHFIEGLDAGIAGALTDWLTLTLTNKEALDNVMKGVREAVLSGAIREAVSSKGKAAD